MLFTGSHRDCKGHDSTVFHTVEVSIKAASYFRFIAGKVRPLGIEGLGAKVKEVFQESKVEELPFQMLLLLVGKNVNDHQQKIKSIKLSEGGHCGQPDNPGQDLLGQC